ncbi:GH23646 [Drosophila grimshawi]|uniref:GH23646 n=1 Tax=Drosophila grimshawi TaxID=7222 RepID=B4K148_DROGR|nr:GH23646 [Drosophila grimshawi]
MFFDLLCVGQIRLVPELPLLQKTRLGWVVTGCSQRLSQTPLLTINSGNTESVTVVGAITTPAPTTTTVMKVEEDEDNRLSEVELQKKLDKIVHALFNCKEAVEKSTNQLRAACFGQDRFCRRHWKLLKADSIFIEALELVQNGICGYQEAFESMNDEKHAKFYNEQKMDDMGVPDEKPLLANPTTGADRAAAAAEPMEVDDAGLVKSTKQDPAKPSPQAFDWRISLLMSC